MPRPDLSVVVLSWNTKGLLEKCLAALRDADDGYSLEIVVIDNASEDGSPDMVAADFPEVILERNPDNRGYAIGVNQGISKTTGHRVCLLGSDTRVRPGTFKAMMQFLDRHPNAGAVAPPLLDDDGTYQRECHRFPTLRTALWWDSPLQFFWPKSKELASYEMREWDHRGTREVDQPPGTCFMVPRRVIDEVGVMDERLWLFFNDVDWSLRIHKAGFEIWYVECPGVYHVGGGSTRHFDHFAAEWHRNRVSFYRKHYHVMGSVITKTVCCYVATRQCFIVKRELPFGKEYMAHCSTIFRTLWQVLQM